MRVNTTTLEARETPLHRAAWYGYTTSCRLLLEHGADVDAVDTKGRTPVVLAIHAGHVEAIELLYAWGAKELVDPFGLP